MACLFTKCGKFSIKLIWPGCSYTHNALQVKDTAISFTPNKQWLKKILQAWCGAAWFHECSYTTIYINHEDSSKTITTAF